tara:strand:- start:6400 stop:6822 length:423 start_codon:yes stop_codon:yes gene_type:complete
MGDRFYQQQIDKTGTCPGLKITKRNRKMAWDDDKKAQVVEMYEAENPTPETSMEIVKDIADEVDESPNGVRMILSKAGVYIKKEQASGTAKAAAGGTRVSKAAAQEALVAAIQDAGKEVDEEIISKLTGKAAQYFTALMS